MGWALTKDRNFDYLRKREVISTVSREIWSGLAERNALQTATFVCYNGSLLAPFSILHNISNIIHPETWQSLRLPLLTSTQLAVLSRADPSFGGLVLS